jgi:hypothetical protein
VGEFPPEPRAAAERLPLSAAEQRLMRLMLGCFQSQRRTLTPFMSLEAEWLRIAPACDFTMPPNGGRVWYDRLPLGVRSEEWRRIIAPHFVAQHFPQATC